MFSGPGRRHSFRSPVTVNLLHDTGVRRHGGEGGHRRSGEGGAGGEEGAARGHHGTGGGEEGAGGGQGAAAAGAQAGLVHTLLHVPLQHVTPLELPAAQLAGVGCGDAALVALVPHQGRLVQVGPTAPRARIFVCERVAAAVHAAGPVLQVQPGQGRQGVVQGRKGGPNTVYTRR